MSHFEEGRTRTARLLAAAAGAFVLLGAAGCGAVIDKSGGSAAGAGGAACDTKAPLHKLVPKDVVAKGCVLKVSSSGTYPPMNYFGPDGKTIVGFQPDLARALEKRLGIKIEYVVANFDAVLGGIASRRYDSAMMTMTDNEERRKQVDFVDYGQSGSSIVVKRGNPEKVATMDDLCGLSVSTVTGYIQVEQLATQSAECAKAGNAKITTMPFPQQVGADQAVATGRAKAQLGDTVTSAYSVRRSKGALELIDAQVEPAPFGMPFRKDRTDLRDAFEAAFKDVLASGEYAQLAAKHGLGTVTPEKITVNDGHDG